MTLARGAVFDGTAGQLRLRDFSLPEPQGAEILVRVRGCTLCGSDLHTLAGRRQVPVPTILGHEIVGQIEAFGESAVLHDLAGQPLAIGDRVTWAIVAHCGHCFYCRRGLPQKCQRGVKYGHEALAARRELTGGLASHCLLAPGTSVVKLPADLPLAVVCPANCATATIAAALEAAGELQEMSVGVLGAGMLGLTAAAMLRARGAGQVICVDPVPARREMAIRFGATRAVAPEELPAIASAGPASPGLDVVLELSGSTAAFESAWPTVRMGGTIVLVGSVFPGLPAAIPLEQLVRRQLSLRGIHNYAPRHLLAAVEFLATAHRVVPLAELVTRWFPLEDVSSAVEFARETGAIRIGVADSAET